MRTEPNLASELLNERREWTDVQMVPLPPFADLVWDSDMTMEEAVNLDDAVAVDHKRSQRRIVLQRIRGQIRYWFTTDRRPEVLNSDQARTVCELGWVASVNEALLLCDEFLIAGAEEPTARRTVLRRE